MKIKTLSRGVAACRLCVCMSLLTGCSTTYHVGYGPSEQKPASIAELLENREVTVRDKRGMTMKGTVAGVSAETLYLLRARAISRTALPFVDITRIEANAGTSSGPVIGGVLGALVGGCAGYLIADKAWGGSPPSGSLESGYHSNANALGILIGILVGTPAGYLVGSNMPPARTFIFSADTARGVSAK